MVRFIKFAGLLLLVNVRGWEEAPRRYLKNKLLGQKLVQYRKHKQLVASATDLSLDDLEKISNNPGTLFNNEPDSLTMSLDELEKISTSSEKLHAEWETSFLTDEDEKRADRSKWNDIMKVE